MNLLQFFWTFLKINFLSTSGPASVGLTHKEMVDSGNLSEEKFTEIIAISSSLPGSDAFQNAILVGYTLFGLIGAIMGFLAAIIPIMIGITLIIIILSYIGDVAWLEHFFSGLKPALTVLLVATAIKILNPEKVLSKDLNYIIIIAIIAILAVILMYWFNIPTGISLVVCGIIGVILKL